MSTEITMKDAFARFMGVYIRSFPRAYLASGAKPADYGRNFAVYKTILETFSPDIFRAAATGINKYLNFYLVRAVASVDEYKIIYFLGRAIERRLIDRGLLDLAKAHSFSMVGLLKFRLKTIGIDKPKLTKAMLLVASAGSWDEQLGQNGCYLIYKTISTTPECREITSV